MQDYKAGHIIGSTPRFLTILAADRGADRRGAVALMYPLLQGDLRHRRRPRACRRRSRSGSPASPTSCRAGFDALPKYSLMFLVIGSVLGIVIALGETRWRDCLPSPTGLGIGMMVPGNVVFTMVLGGVLYSWWNKVDKASADKLAMPLASGLIAGEASWRSWCPRRSRCTCWRRSGCCVQKPHVFRCVSRRVALPASPMKLACVALLGMVAGCAAATASLNASTKCSRLRAVAFRQGRRGGALRAPTRPAPRAPTAGASRRSSFAATPIPAPAATARAARSKYTRPTHSMSTRGPPASVHPVPIRSSLRAMRAATSSRCRRSPTSTRSVRFTKGIKLRKAYSSRWQV